ncbi:MAG: photosystem II stability/assembly factor-like uncharacterized protein [Saprospiraceae bacterium]|jgi:photosystem II stability/assembly factor-like uncharacterized protein
MKKTNLIKPSINFVLLLFTFLIFIPHTEAQKRKRKSETAVNALITKSYDDSLYNSIEWRNIGPFRGGRSCTVAGVPGKPNLFYFGSTGGGVWKTSDGGRHWENISDGYFGGSVGAIAVSESDPNVIYAGGGEVTVRGNVSSGYGIWKTEDAGKTWKQMGLKDSRHLSRIRIHPKDHNIVYASSMGNLYKANEERGVYKSTDGGNNWKKVLYINEEVGVADLCLDPNNHRIMYATSWRIKRTPYDLSSGGEGSKIFKSTDSGETWEDITYNKGLPKGTRGISGITVSPANSDRLWTIIESKEGGVFRSDDAGATWIKVNDERKLRQRAWYYTRIYADPQDENAVYVMNVRYHKSTDGGKTFKSSRTPHGDHHDLWIAPENPDRIIVADDGGAQVTYDNGDTWSTYHNQPTAQFYRVITDNHFPYRIYAAQQDNSTIRISHRSSGGAIDEDDWESTAGCECGHIAIDPLDNDIVYGGCYDGFLERKDHKTGFTRVVSVWPDNPMGHGAEGMRYRFQWNFPIFFSQHDPKKLYTASNHLHASTDGGQSWELISPDLTRNDSTKLGPSGGPITKDNTSVEYYCTIFAATESPRVKDLLWVGSDDGLVHISKDGGKNWDNITPPDMPEWIQVNSIEADPHNDGGAYLACTMYKSGDFQPYLYKTKDYGKSWTKITQGIDKEHFTRVVRADPIKPGILYAGTEAGMYISFDDGANWQSFQMNLPIVPITDLTIKNNNLIAATQGRSLWIIDDLTVLHQLEKVADANVYLYQPMPAYRTDGYQNKNVKDAGLNHPGGVVVHYYLKNKPDTAEIKLTFWEAGGEVIKSYSTKAKEKGEKLEVKKGANMFSWNMSYPEAKRFDGMILWWASLSGPTAIPGDYKVTLNVGGKEIAQDFKILKDPRTTTSDADLKAQFDFIKEIGDKLTESHETIINIRDIRKQMNNYTTRLPEGEEMKDLRDAAAAIDSTLTVVEKNLYQTQNQSGQDPLNFPIRLTNKLASLNSMTRGGDFPPTDQAVAVKNELMRDIDVQLEIYRAVLEKDLPGFNELVRAKAIDAVILKVEKG